eukprot:TRINITY_DN3895_c0_g1_i3.p1 TRINITY_DN3895_c0_g1~~TRINITY_DN3895_c0_g1_i3.p1  ORF type:complete len:133 (+),score=15.72 TRINITY_DN3895_c0_g1_i3:45-443(+)
MPLCHPVNALDKPTNWQTHNIVATIHPWFQIQRRDIITDQLDDDDIATMLLLDYSDSLRFRIVANKLPEIVIAASLTEQEIVDDWELLYKHDVFDNIMWRGIDLASIKAEYSRLTKEEITGSSCSLIFSAIV